MPRKWVKANAEGGVKEEALSWAQCCSHLEGPDTDPGWETWGRPGALSRLLGTLVARQQASTRDACGPGRHLPPAPCKPAPLSSAWQQWPTVRGSCPRGNGSPDLTPSRGHRCRGPKMRAKLVCNRPEPNPLLLLGQLAVEKGDAQRVWEPRPPGGNLQRQTTLQVPLPDRPPPAHILFT